MMVTERYNAPWWNDQADSSWDKVKEAFRRDWEQTKHDFGGKSPDLNQDVPDTVKQAAGKQPIPAPGQPTYESYEHAFRFGHGARLHYSKQYPTWNDQLESTLRKDWSSTSDDAEWKRHRDAVRHAYEYEYNYIP